MATSNDSTTTPPASQEQPVAQLNESAKRSDFAPTELANWRNAESAQQADQHPTSKVQPTASEPPTNPQRFAPPQPQTHSQSTPLNQTHSQNYGQDYSQAQSQFQPPTQPLPTQFAKPQPTYPHSTQASPMQTQSFHQPLPPQSTQPFARPNFTQTQPLPRFAPQPGQSPAQSHYWTDSSQSHSQPHFQPPGHNKNYVAPPPSSGFSAAPASPFAPRPSVRVPLLIWGLLLIIGGLALVIIVSFPTISGSLLFIGMLLLLGICLLVASFVTLRRK